MLRWLLLAMSVLAFGAEEDGAALFQQRCATCHKEPPVNRAPQPEALGKLSRETILQSLATGSMKEMAAGWNEAQRLAVAAHLSRADAIATPAGQCAPGFVSRSDSTFWNGWGVDETNSRHQPPHMAGLDAAAVPSLKLAWAFGLPGAAMAMAQPTAFAGRLYFGSQDGTVYAIDAATGCTFWTYKARATVRAAIQIATVAHARQAALFGDTMAWLYAIDLKNGKLLWDLKLDDHPVARITGAPKLSGSRLYVPVSSIEEVSGGGPKYGCCTFRGSVVAIDIESGKQVWKSYTIPDPPAPTRKNAEGVQLQGPAGAAVWLSPTLDLKARLVYAGTGNAYADPSTPYSDAVIALDMDTGALKWSRQLAENDRWNIACVSPNKANCPEKSGPDFDIGASPILRHLANGKRVLVVGQKSGVVYGLDPDERGRLVWQTRIGEGSLLGGVQWGMAADRDHVYVGLSDVHLRERAGGLFALRLSDGAKVWHVPPVKPVCFGKAGCTAAQMAALTVIDGAVFAGSMDGMLRAHDTKSGAVLWEFDTNRDFETVNGVKAKGGSISSSGPVIVGGRMFVNSGYGALGGMAGNVLLSFAPSSK